MSAETASEPEGTVKDRTREDETAGAGPENDAGSPENNAQNNAEKNPKRNPDKNAQTNPNKSGAANPEESAEQTVRDAISAPDATGVPRRATRRFPRFTRDTARPEGGGRAAPRDAPAPARQWPILAVLSAVGLGLLLTALDVFRFGTILVGAALIGGAVLRWALPDVGMLAVRSRFTDMVTYGFLGAGIVLLAMMAQPNPWLEIPFLDDTLHFTIR
ncbi:membrane protein [Streptomyces bluensis]|nr:DUF3017 domain-containing protein [Streptomyces bluensis]GGZ57517.1 membrane protein [Streptomyces bluensis]